MEKNGLFSQRIRLRHLHTFVAVAQQGTLGRAAETLNLSQPALSKTLNELEQLTGARLFDRGRLGAQLTIVGEQFLTHAVKVLDALITNFHLPESTLIMLVSAFCGYENTMNAYKIAVREKYRFFSFGDAMLIE